MRVEHAHRKCCWSSGSGLRRQKSVCVVTTSAGTTAAISVSRLPTPDDVAIGEPRAREPHVGQQRRERPPGRCAARSSPRLSGTAKCACRPVPVTHCAESFTVVGGIQLAAESCGPAVALAQRRKPPANVEQARDEIAPVASVRESGAQAAARPIASWSAASDSGVPSSRSLGAPGSASMSSVVACRSARECRACGARSSPTAPENASRDESGRCPRALSRPTLCRRCPREELLPQRRGAVVRWPAPHGSTSPTRPPGLARRSATFDEGLIEIQVAAVDARIESRLPHERHEAAAIAGAHDVPWRIADHGVEPCAAQSRAVVVVEHIGKLERPVKETVLDRPSERADRAIAADVTQRERAIAAQQRVNRGADLGSSGWPPVAPEPSRAPQIAGRAPAGRRATGRPRCPPTDVPARERHRRVVVALMQPAQWRHHVAYGRIELEAGARTGLRTSRSGVRDRARRPARGLRETRPDERVAAREPVIEEAERLVARQRREPQRQPRELDGHRIGIHARETACGYGATYVRARCPRRGRSPRIGLHSTSARSYACDRHRQAATRNAPLPIAGSTTRSVRMSSARRACEQRRQRSTDHESASGCGV